MAMHVEKKYGEDKQISGNAMRVLTAAAVVFGLSAWVIPPVFHGVQK